MASIKFESKPKAKEANRMSHVTHFRSRTVSYFTFVYVRFQNREESDHLLACFEIHIFAALKKCENTNFGTRRM